MAVNDNNFELEECCHWLDHVPLCSIQDMEWFPIPNSLDHFLSLNDEDKDKGNQKIKKENVKHEKRDEVRKERVENLLHGLSGFTIRKSRTKNYQRPKWRVKWERKKCSHCETEETPQWREGPKGPKTLCNACGMRFKKGRLVPEYRPATSPTFDCRRHSNYHKMILKLRSST